MPKAKKKANKESSEAPGAGLSQDIGDEMAEVNPLTDSQLDQMTDLAMGFGAEPSEEHEQLEKRDELPSTDM